MVIDFQQLGRSRSACLCAAICYYHASRMIHAPEELQKTYEAGLRLWKKTGTLPPASAIRLRAICDNIRPATALKMLKGMS
jgi:hypothetical protein